MIEISAKLSRGSVYFANESLRCLVSYKNVGNNIERLAWSGAEIHCHLALDEARVVGSKIADLSEKEVTCSSKETSFHPAKGEKGRLILSTKPKILFCDLTLNPGESKTYIYEETIPLDSPPSYYGSSVKYMYKLTIGTQRVNCVIQLLRMPLRVITIVRDTCEIETASDSENGTVEEIVASPTSNFNDHNHKETTLDLVLHQIDCLAGKRSPSNYLITNQTGRIARFCLFKNTFKLGEDIVGFFDFTESTVPCVQFSATLQSEETLKEEFRVQSGKSAHITSHSNYHEFCLYLNNAEMILPIPLTVTPAFETNLMTLTWKLHVEFVTTRPEDIVTRKFVDSQGVMEQAPAEIKVQTMVWDLPINVLPTHPLQIGRGLSMPATMAITI